MSTGAIDTWNTAMADLGPLYPWPGTEFVWFIIGMALWIGWHVIQARMEKAQYEEEVKRFGDAESLEKLLAEEESAK